MNTMCLEINIDAQNIAILHYIERIPYILAKQSKISPFGVDLPAPWAWNSGGVTAAEV